MRLSKFPILALALVLTAGRGASAADLPSPAEAGYAKADWPQFMRDAAHTGDAAEEALQLPLGLGTRVQLDDAILSSPAVVGGRVFVVDQLGTAYAVDPRTNQIVWKVSPDGDAALGGNAGSPCVVKGRVYYGTTTGRVHILDVRDGGKIASVDVGSAVPSSLTYANDSLYFQTLDAHLVRMGLDGRILWRHDHRRDYKFTGRPAEWPKGYQKDQYGGGEVAVSGKRAVANIGCDLVCLEDLGDKPKIAWCQRRPIMTMGPAISGEWVYVAQPGNDGDGGYARVRLADGTSDPKIDYVGKHWIPFATPAVRDQTVFVQSHNLGMLAYDFAKAAQKWKAWDDVKWKEGTTPGLASPALSREHCVFATVRGEIHVVGVEGAGGWKSSF